MSIWTSISEENTALTPAEDVPDGARVALIGSGHLARRSGSVEEVDAEPGEKWEGLAGLPLFALEASGDFVHINPRAPVLVIADEWGQPQQTGGGEQMRDIEKVAERYALEVMNYHGVSWIGTEVLGGGEYVVIFDIGDHAIGFGVKGGEVIEELGHSHLVDRGWM